MGHGVAGLLCGGRITYLQIYGLRIVPMLSWSGMDEGLGACDVEGVEGRARAALVKIAGSISTWLASLAATILVLAREWRRLTRVVLMSMSFWWLDFFTFMLPSVGISRYGFVGTMYSEPFEAAMELGFSGWLFHVVALCMIVASVVLTARVVIHFQRQWYRILKINKKDY